MTDWIQWFRFQLKASGDGFAWAFEQLPPAYHYKLPHTFEHGDTLMRMGLWWGEIEREQAKQK